MNDEKKQERKCFIITPIGNENSEVFRKAKGVIESVIKPVLKKYGYDDIKPAYEINTSGMINTQIINRIIEDDLVVANLTGNNPNVMYELCLRHIVAKPIIHICENGTVLPFDIKDNRTIFYENDMLGVDELSDMLESFVVEISYEHDYMDNPIYTAYSMGKLLKETQGTKENEIVKLLINLNNEVSEIKSNPKALSYNDLKTNEEHTVREFNQNIASIDKNKAKDLLSNLSGKMKVYEVAKELETYSWVVAQIVNAKSSLTSLSKSEIEKVVNYICS